VALNNCRIPKLAGRRQLSVVAETHETLPHLSSAVDALGLVSLTPKFTPDRVTVCPIEPGGPLYVLVYVSTGASYENIVNAVPIREAPLASVVACSDSEIALPVPADGRMLTTVFDVHDEVSANVAPMIAEGVVSSMAKLSPATLIRAPVLIGRLAGCTMLVTAAASYVKCMAAVPTEPATVS
jgi:hypothetical protein